MNPNKKNTFEKPAIALLVVFIVVAFCFSYKSLIRSDISTLQNSAGAGNAGGNTLLAAPSEKLVLTGGLYNLSLSQRDGYTATNPAIWTATPTPAWTARYQHQTVFFQGKLWLMGGFASPSGYSNDVYSSADGVTWTFFGAAPWAKRSQFGALVFNNKLYVMGGAGVSGYYKDVWSFNGTTWTLVGNANWSARSKFGAVVFNDGTGDKIYVLGGGGTAAPILNDVWSWSGTGAWTQKTATMLPYISFANDANFITYDNGSGSKIYRLGQTINSTNTGNANVWSSVNGVNWVEQPWAAWGSKKSLESVVYNDGTGKKLYVLGGTTVSPLGGTHDIWKATNPDIVGGWSLVTANPTWSSRFGHSVAVMSFKPDLVITSIKWSDTYGAAPNNLPITHSNDPYIYFTFVVKNIGTADAVLTTTFPPFELSMDSVPQALSIPPFLLTSLGSTITLSPGQSYTFNNIPNSSASTMRANVGSYVLTATVDSHLPGAVDELSETNNTATTTLIIN